MPRETQSPIDLPGAVRLGPGDLRRASVTIAVATVFLLLTNAVSLRDWIDERRPGPLQSAAASAADAWVGFTGRVGLGTPRAALHDRWKHAEAARFAGQPRASAE